LDTIQLILYVLLHMVLPSMAACLSLVCRCVYLKSDRWRSDYRWLLQVAAWTSLLHYACMWYAQSSGSLQQMANC